MERTYGGNSFNRLVLPGDPEYMTMEQVGERLKTNYLGRVEFGVGAIDASAVSVRSFQTHLERIKDRHMLPMTFDYMDEYGNCMDGRGNICDENGQPVRPRVKILGGPNLFAWYAALIGDFEIVTGMDAEEAFRRVSQLLKVAGFKLGMHHSCGAAGGPKPIVEMYIDHFDDISDLVGDKAADLLDGGNHGKGLIRGLHKTAKALDKASGLTPERMLEITRSLDGKAAIVYLDEDPNHPAHGHDEDGLVFNRADGFMIDKMRALDDGINVFYHNTVYAEKLLGAISSSREEMARGIIIADQLPIAGIAVLGKGQHVGEILPVAA